jgi:hypothetical protein
MSYVGNVPTTAAFPFDQFSGNGSTTAFTLSYAPAGSTSIIVCNLWRSTEPEHVLCQRNNPDVYPSTTHGSKLTVDGAFSITGQGRSTTGWAVSADGSTFTPSGLNAIPNYGTGYITSTSFTTLAGFGGASFYTNQLERMRIDGFGNFMVGTTSPTARFTVAESGNAPASDFYTSGGAVGTPCMYVKKQPNDGTTSQVYIQFLYNNAGSGNGQINGNGSGAAAFGSYSDERLKENISDIPPQLENICALRPVEFDYKTGGHQVGFIAQEMQEVYPDVVGTASDEMLTITGWSKTEARLVKAIQEQQQMIETLQAKVAALEAGQ